MQKHHLVERFSSASLNVCLNGLAERINRDYEGKKVLLIGVLNGAFIFMADLARRLDLSVKMDFVRLSSYGDRSESSGKVKISKDVELPVEGMHVLVVEDIVDTGTTLKWFTEYLKGLGPESVKICALIDKSERREVDVAIDYVGISVESGFLVGYGLDFSEKYRHLPAIYEVVFDNA
ncbi:MAG: hypoxanthine phosphoribosyltransferase [Desulfobacteraceae bacterium]|nr:hypoxanthine phosphoribosyltransferase [Desulfobacteraceae bacterium]